MLHLEIWSDVVCPWCYVGKRNLDRALADFVHRDDVEVTWRSFELDPGAPAEREGGYVERLARKYGVTADEALAMCERMVDTAAKAGATLHFDRARPGNTFDAHRLLHLAKAKGVQVELEERLFAATFTEGEPIGDRETLVRLAADAGIDQEEARAALATGAYADDVRADERMAQAYGISGVPFFVVDQTYGVSGAQPPHVLRNVLEQAWNDRLAARTLTPVPGDDAAACEADVCDL